MLILEDITERKKNTGKGLIRGEGSIIEHQRNKKLQQELKVLQEIM